MTHHQVRYSIAGMHCKACELLVEAEVRKIPQVKSVRAAVKTGQVVLTTIQSPSPELQQAVQKAVTQAGYQLTNQQPIPWVTPEVKTWQEVGLALAVVVLGWLFLNKLGIGTVMAGPTIDTNSLFTIATMGLTAGFSTCAALVGGLLLALSGAQSKSSSTQMQSGPVTLFLLGRVLGFMVFGALLGWLGAFLQPSPVFSAVLSLLVAGVMLLLGLQQVGMFPKLSAWQFALPTTVASWLGLRSQVVHYSPFFAVVLGVMTFFMPCGFTQAVQAYALSTGSALEALVTLGVFAVGTIPGLVVLGLVGQSARRATKLAFLTRLVGVVIVAFALSTAGNAYYLLQAGAGFGAHTPTPVNSDSTQVQIVRMVQGTHGYAPNKIQVKKGVKVRWIIDSQDQNTCASSILLAKYGINSPLRAGENIFEFTPTKVEKLTFSCSMGMYRGTMEVVE